MLKGVILLSVIVYFGVPGSGKTTLAAKIAYENARRGITTYSNVPILGTLYIDSSDIGKYDISNGELILDEAAIDFNNRSYKTMPKAAIDWFKLHRHYGISRIHVFSQSFEDMDITLRRLQTSLHRLSRTFIPGVFMSRRISPFISIDRDTHQITETYKWSGLPRFYFGFKYWPMFDSYAAPALFEHVFESVGIPTGTSFKALRKRIRAIRSESLKERFLSFFVSLHVRMLVRRARLNFFLNNIKLHHPSDNLKR